MIVKTVYSTVLFYLWTRYSQKSAEENIRFLGISLSADEME